MLAMNQSAMAQMETDHLLAALEAEGHITPAEKELARRLNGLAGQETPDEVEARLERSYESALEQSSFRARAIEEILEICEQPGTAEELKARIKTRVENSYVEL